MKLFRSVILDDEPMGLEATRQFLQKLPYIDIVAEAADLEQAEREILFHKPDIVFLDIKIFGETVFPLLDRLYERQLELGVVFITGYDNQYLEEAMEACQMRYKWTYCHKPIQAETMLKAINRFRKDLGYEEDRYILHQQGEIIQLFFKDILYFETLGNSAKVYFNDGRSVSISDNLSTLEKKLPKTHFYRLSSQHLINRAFFKRAYRSNNQKYFAVLHTPNGGEEIKMKVPREKWTALRLAFPPSVD